MLFAIGTACCRAIATGMGQLLLLLAYEATDAAATAFRLIQQPQRSWFELFVTWDARMPRKVRELMVEAFDWTWQ
jgi:hypothetical protein